MGSGIAYITTSSDEQIKIVVLFSPEPILPPHRLVWLNKKGLFSVNVRSKTARNTVIKRK